jgi:hypothetical protein
MIISCPAIDRLRIIVEVRSFEICAEFLHWKVVFCILSPVSKISFERIDLERDEDFSMH